MSGKGWNGGGLTNVSGSGGGGGTQVEAGIFDVDYVINWVVNVDVEQDDVVFEPGEGFFVYVKGQSPLCVDSNERR